MINNVLGALISLGITILVFVIVWFLNKDKYN